MASTPCAARDIDDEMSVTCDSQDVRKQLQNKVADSLTSRKVSSEDLWKTKPKATMSKSELQRLERQRANKRRWAQKEREKSKALLTQLKQTNTDLEHQNQQLHKQVDLLQHQQISMKNTLLTHKCKITDHKPRLLKVIRFQNHLGDTTNRNIIISGKQDSSGLDKVYRNKSVISQDSGLPGKSSSSDKLTEGMAPIGKNTITISNINANIFRRKNAFLPLTPETKTTQKIHDACTRSVLIEQPGTSAEEQNFVALGSARPVTDTQERHEAMDVAMAGHKAGQPLMSGGSTVSDLTKSRTSFLQLLLRDDAIEDCKVPGGRMLLQTDPELRTELVSEQLLVGISSEVVPGIHDVKHVVDLDSNGYNVLKNADIASSSMPVLDSKVSVSSNTMLTICSKQVNDDNVIDSINKEKQAQNTTYREAKCSDALEYTINATVSKRIEETTEKDTAMDLSLDEMIGRSDCDETYTDGRKSLGSDTNLWAVKDSKKGSTTSPPSSWRCLTSIGDFPNKTVIRITSRSNAGVASDTVCSGNNL